MEPPNDVRARFAHKSSYRVDGAPVKASHLSLRSMNFGQHWRTGSLASVSYTLSLPLAWGVEVCERDWEGWVEDAKRFPSHEAVEVRLRQLGWPAARDAVRHDAVAQLLAVYFSHDILLGWLGDGPPEQAPGFVLNTIDDVAVEAGAGVITMSGSARKHEPSLVYEYQDV